MSKDSGITVSNCLTLILLSILNTAVKIYLIKGLSTPFSIKNILYHPQLSYKHMRADIIKYINEDMKVFDWKVDQREKNSVTVWYDESPFGENESSESAKKGSLFKVVVRRGLFGPIQE